MARKRMFSLEVVDTDRFLDMPAGSQLLYFHLGMHADDDGFVSSPKRIMRTVNCKEDDLRTLEAEGYIISFESGIIVIRHWKQNNYLRKDRYVPTIHIKEYAQLSCVNDVYEKVEIISNETCQPVSNEMVYQAVGERDTQRREEKNRLEKDRVEIEEDSDIQALMLCDTDIELTPEVIIEAFNKICTSYNSADLEIYTGQLSSFLLLNRYTYKECIETFIKAEVYHSLYFSSEGRELDFAWVLENFKDIRGNMQIDTTKLSEEFLQLTSS